jgi:hypothetical protein
MNYKPLKQAKLKSKGTTRVFHSPTPSLPQGQADFGSRYFRPIVKLLSNHTATSRTHHTLNCSFLSVLQIVRPTVSYLDSVRPSGTSDYDLPGLQSHSNTGALNKNVG